MGKIIASALLAFTVTLTGLTAEKAFAQDAKIIIDGNGVRLGSDRDRRGDRDRHNRDRHDRDRDDDRGDNRRECTPDRALAKAQRMGIRRARVVDVGRRTIDVSGRSRDGDRIMVSFGRRDRSCPLLR